MLTVVQQGKARSFALVKPCQMSSCSMLPQLTVHLFRVLSSTNSLLCHLKGSLGSASAMLSCKGHKPSPEEPRPCTVVMHIDLVPLSAFMANSAQFHKEHTVNISLATSATWPRTL